MRSMTDSKEADTRLILHSLHAPQSGNKNLMICTLGTDVVVLAVAKINELGSGETWKQGKTFATSQYMQL